MEALDEASVSIAVIITSLYWLAHHLIDCVGDIKYPLQRSNGGNNVVPLVLHYIFMVELFQVFTALFPCESLTLLVVGLDHNLQIVYIKYVEILELVPILFEEILDL